MGRAKKRNITNHQDATEKVPEKVPRTTRKGAKKDENDEKSGPGKKGKNETKKGPSKKPPIRPPVTDSSDTDDDFDSRPPPLGLEQVETEIADNSFSYLDDDEDDEITIRNCKCNSNFSIMEESTVFRNHTKVSFSIASEAS